MRRVRIKDEALEQRMFFQRVLLAAALVTLIAIALVGRAFWLQVVQHAHYVELSQGNRARIEPLPPNRGIIYDRGGRVIAENTPAYQLELIPNRQATSRTRSPGSGASAWSSRATSAACASSSCRGARSRPCLSCCSSTTRKSRATPCTGTSCRHPARTRMARHYPYGTVGAHALGYVGTISEPDLVRVDRERYFGTGVIGKTGVERAYEAELLGTGGYREVLVNAEGRPARLAEGADRSCRPTNRRRAAPCA